MKIEFSETILKKSFKDFKAELDCLFRDQAEDDREISFKKLYKDATGKEPDQPGRGFGPEPERELLYRRTFRQDHFHERD